MIVRDGVVMRSVRRGVERRGDDWRARIVQVTSGDEARGRRAA